MQAGLPLARALEALTAPGLWAAFASASAAAGNRRAWTAPDDALAGEVVRSFQDTDLVRAKERAWKALTADLLRRLRSGEFVAYGFEAPVRLHSERVQIPADKWEVLTPDFDLSEAQGNGIVLVGVVVSQSSDAADATPARATRSAETRCRKWMRAKAESGSIPPTKGAAFAAARAEIGDALSRRAFNRVWRSSAPEAWKSPGRRSKRNLVPRIDTQK